MINKTLLMRSASILIIIVGVIFAQQSISARSIVVEEDVTYGSVGDTQLKLDLAHPREGAGPFPAIVFIHGGAWAGGSRKDYRSWIERAAKKGFVAATISYRLTQPDPVTKVGKFPFPAQIHDCKCAVRWLRSVADKYHIDTDRIGVTGGSAGGHLSLLVGFADKDAGLEGDGGHADQSSRVNAVVNYCGPTDLVHEYQDIVPVRDFLVALCGGPPDLATDAYQQASPLTYITHDDPPVLTLHGDKDDIVPLNQATFLDEAMKKAGVPHDLIILKGQGHGFQGQAQSQAENAMWTFFEKHLLAN
jgi:acetyl esterase/lipase